MATSEASILRISDEKTLELVKLYKKESCLWDTTSQDYKIKIKRRLAAERIAKILNIPNFEPRHVMIKFRNLRNAYCQDLKKTAIMQNLREDDDTASPMRKQRAKPLWYAVMDTFIRPHLQAHFSHSGPTLVINSGIIKREPEQESMEDPDELWENNISEDMPHIQASYSVPEPPTDIIEENSNEEPETNKRPASSIEAYIETNSPKRMRSEDLLAESLKEVSAQLAVLKDDLASTKVTQTQKDKDFCDDFGKYVASLFKLLPMSKVLLLQPKIVNMIAAEILDEQDEIILS